MIELCLSTHIRRVNWSKQVDQNAGGALLEFPMRTAMHLKSSVLSAMSVCLINKISKLVSQQCR